MEVEVRLFADLHKKMNASIIMTPLEPFHVSVNPSDTVGDLIEHLGLSGEAALIVLINGLRQEEDWILEEGDRVAIFPPIGGG